MSEITVFAKITARPDCVAQVLAELKTLVALVRREPGCVEYRLHQNLQRPELFHFYEVWGSQALLDQHAAAAALTAFQKKAADWVAGMEVSLTRAVE